MRCRALLFFIMLLVGAPWSVLAYGVGTPVATDSRIKTFVYNENDVYRLLTHYGYQLNIEFGNKEEIETISVGDRTGWQIIPAGQRLFVRGMEDKAHTNMTVVTNRHAYQFDLYSSPPGEQGWDELVYVVRFYYPEEDTIQTASVSGAGFPMGGSLPAPPMMNTPAPYAAPASPMPSMAPMNSMGSMGYPPSAPAPAYGSNTPMGYPSLSDPMGGGYGGGMASMQQPAMAPAAPGGAPNYNYSFTGEQSILPTQMYDDGQRTYLGFNTGQMPPQIFAVSPSGQEQPVMGSNNGGMIVLPGTYARLILRFGSSYACVYNEAMAMAR